MIIDDLIQRIIKVKNPIAISLDTKFEYIPEYIKQEHDRTRIADMIFHFNMQLIDETYDIIPAITINIGFYEQYGLDGIKCYMDTIKYAKSKKLIVIGDVKRGDTSTAAKGYSIGHLGNLYFTQDFVTINPYTGYDTIEPFLEEMKRHDKGIFNVVKTDNTMSHQIQKLRLDDGRFVYEEVAKLTQDWGFDYRGKYGYSIIGAIFETTVGAEIKYVKKTAPNVFLVIPYHGSFSMICQQLSEAFDENGLGAMICNSREVLLAYKNVNYDYLGTENFAKSSRQYIMDMRDRMTTYVNIVDIGLK